MADVATRLKGSLAILVEAGPEPGRAWCRAWTDEVDAALRELHGGSEPGGRLSVVAVGGYGRRELCPGSDIDLLLLHERLRHDQLEALVRDVVYPLWDAGLKVGHAVRDARQAVSIALDDAEVGTALLDARVVAGDTQLLRDTRDRLIAKLRRKPAGFLQELAAADAARRDRVGDAAEMLEPDLKRGAGSLRDVQSLRWAAAALLGEPALDPLVSARYLGAPDRSRLARAYEHLLRVRVALHLVAERPTDVLRLDLQQQVAERLGYGPRDGTAAAADAMLHDVYLSARAVDHVHRRAWTLLDADAVKGRRFRRSAEVRRDGFGIVDGVLRIEDATTLEDPSLPTHLLEALIAHDAVLDRTSAAEIRRAADRQVGGWTWSPGDRDRFLRALWAGRRALPAIAELDDVGLLEGLIPEWGPLRGRPQRNPFHRFSLDRHALHAATGLVALVAEESWATDAVEAIDDRDGLMLGTLLHDVGKAYGEPHSETGVPVARAIVERLGYGDGTADLVAAMVRHHLLLPDVATRRDINEPGLAGSVAETVGDTQTLACLHLLAAADGRATGPTAWSSWKATLVHQLVERVRTVLDDTHPDVTVAAASDTARQAQDLAESLGVDPAVVRAHLAALPTRYAAAVEPRAVVRHAGMAATRPASTEVRTRVTPASDGAAYGDLDVVAEDRSGLFARVAGVLALHGGSVLAAHAYTRRDGIAVDTFTVEAPRDDVGPWWAGVEGDIHEAIAGRLALRARVAKKAERERRRPGLPDVATTVDVHADEAGTATVVEVHTQDRVGLLFQLASALAELELDVVVAKISTVGHEAVDVFYVRDREGRPLDDDHAREVVVAIRAALED